MPRLIPRWENSGQGRLAHQHHPIERGEISEEQAVFEEGMLKKPTLRVNC